MKLAISLAVAATTSLVAFNSYAGPQFSDRIGSSYASLNAGANTLDDTSFNFATGVDVENDYDSGFVVSGEIGHNLGKVAFIDNVKLGAELGYSDNEIDVHTIPALGGEQPGSVGDLTATTLLLNMYHEFDTSSRIVPYYGVGVGAAIVDAEEFGVAGVPNALDDDDTSFLYQGTVGANYMLTSNMDIGARYRYSATEGLELTGSGTGAQTTDFDYESHNFTVNLSYNF